MRAGREQQNVSVPALPQFFWHIEQLIGASTGFRRRRIEMHATSLMRLPASPSQSLLPEAGFARPRAASLGRHRRNLKLSGGAEAASHHLEVVRDGDSPGGAYQRRGTPFRKPHVLPSHRPAGRQFRGVARLFVSWPHTTPDQLGGV
ncbi:hypothetical protein HPP92_013594 [Vanilla planifolia]|uniref:Uncharacterized protein n=1 Tax=Vanilla planifolia TaxID=51239 RepID=A0A835UWU3_VANPL|nr:hypothetical protein HPP92_013594 [Vanilla planifolia]